MRLTELQRAILSSLADDAEDLERLYQQLALDFMPGQTPPIPADCYYWRLRPDGFTLREIADALLFLSNAAFLKLRTADGVPIPSIPNDGAYIWRCWFELSEQGRQALHEEGKS